MSILKSSNRIVSNRRPVLSSVRGCLTIPTALLLLSGSGCLSNPDKMTLAELRDREPDLAEAEITDGIDQAMAGYRAFLEQAPISSLTPEAMRRLADLQIEKEYGILETPAASPADPALGESIEDPSRELTGLQPALPRPDSRVPRRATHRADASAGSAESESDFESRATRESVGAFLSQRESLVLPSGDETSEKGPLEAIALYDQILETYPDYAQNDQVLYQKSRAHDELGQVDEAMEVAALLVERFPASRHLDEIQFRRAEYFFTRKKFIDAERGYKAIVDRGAGSNYFELALYKLGWTYYKQMLLPEAVETYVALLDHKVDLGYDFDQAVDDSDEQRIADTYRVMSLCFSELGGATAVTSFFAEAGARSYEDRVYRHLGEFYLEKLRYSDAASVYQAFVDLYPIHRSSPPFSMRIVEIYEVGDFPKLVLASKKSFAARYALAATYWNHFDVAEFPEVLGFLKSNLQDLANHYHSLYQTTEVPEDKPAHFSESVSWYQAYLDSFPSEQETPQIHYQLADLFLENENYSRASSEYERIAYEYPEHERSSDAGYAAIFAHREHENATLEDERDGIRRAAVESTRRFVARFPEHEHAPTVLGAAVQDLYTLKELSAAIAAGKQLIGNYPDSDAELRRAAWTVIAHASLDSEEFENAEQAYAEVLDLTPEGHESIAAITNNLAASIYRQGERATQAEDHQTAARHYLRIADVAPESDIRPIAEYDAGSALIKLADWTQAAAVLEAFRGSFPEHELSAKATRQLAFVHRENADPGRAAEEYLRVAAEATDPELRAEALVVAGDLYTEAENFDAALRTYRRFVTDFTDPLEPTVVTRFKMSNLYSKIGDEDRRLDELRTIVQIDRGAGSNRTDRIRSLAAKSALTLAELDYAAFERIALAQPFETSLAKKQKSMKAALRSLDALVEYEIGEVTAAATFYIGELYIEFSRALLESERPSDLSGVQANDYEMLLEEEAFPFEEKSIVIHKKNLELMQAGVFNSWIEKSIGRLAVVMPGRFAKFEVSSGILNVPETYAYIPPQREPEPLTAAAVPSPDPVDGSTEHPASNANEIPAAEADAEPAVVIDSTDADTEPAVVNDSTEADATNVPAAPAPSAEPESSPEAL